VSGYCNPNALAEQMGVGADDDRHDPYQAETPEPCRGCNSLHCDSECAEFRAWLTVAYLDWDAASGGDADARP
jgi:hypothetical protein